MSIICRAFQKTDIPAIIQVINANEVQRNDPGRTTEEDLQQLVSAPFVHAEEDFSVALNGEQEIVGAAMMVLRPNTSMFMGDVFVHPDYHQASAAAELVERSEARALQIANAKLADKPTVQILLGVQEYKTYLRTILEATGYSEVRRQYVMRIALDAPVQRPTFPPEYELRPFDRDHDTEAVYHAFQESFADHWGAVSQTPYEQFAHQLDNPHFDPTLWYILYRDHDIVGFCLSEASTREEKLGLVDLLGVRPAYRKSGLGGLLLRHAFCEFQQRGYQQVALDVDAENTTNAVAVYEKAGMSVYRYTSAYRKMLRGTPEDIED